MKDAVQALEVRDFRRFFFAALASNSGTWLQGLAMPFVMYDITGSGTWVGASVFCLLIPMALVGPIAGPMADRLPRRDILIVTQAALGVIAGGFAALWWLDVRNAWAYLGVALVYGVGNGFSMPAWQAFVSDLVPRDRLMNAIALNSLQFNASRAIGPSLGGLVLAALGPGWAFAGNGLSFSIVVITLMTLPVSTTVRERPTESPLRQFVEGSRYARTRPGIMTGFFAAALLAFLGGTLAQVHLVLFAEEVFDVDEFRFGVLVSAFGLGAVIAAPWVAAVAPRVPRARTLVIGLSLYGFGELLLCATRQFWIGVVGVLFAGAAHILTATTTNTTLQFQVTETMRGRVIGIYLMVVTMGMPVGAVIEGPLADTFGVRTVVSVMGAGMLAGAVWLWTSGRAATYDEE